MSQLLNEASWLPLFPLQTVLFPDGVLPLRIFETRYIDMVRECMRLEQPFGVVAIRTGSETDTNAEPETVGCIASIDSWDMVVGGLLMIRARGTQRFRIRNRRVLTDRRLEARIDLLPSDITTSPTTMHVHCAEALKLVADDFEQRALQEPQYADVFARPLRLDDAGWVANRWCEILPISLKARQKLLEVDDPATRLSIVFAYLQQHNIL